MDKLLKPKLFDTDPSLPDADQQWHHWKLTFDNFLDTFTEAELTDRRKLAALINCLSSSVYTYISSSSSFEDAITTLSDIYVKPKNEVYVRHLLSSRKQQEGETVDQFMHALDMLSKDCNFKAVDATAYRDEYFRDSLIRGLQSSEMRQRLLEGSEGRKEVFTKARTLELAFKNNQQFQSQSYVNSAVRNEEVHSDDSKIPDSCCSAMRTNKPFFNKNQNRSSSSCYFCGFDYHNRRNCPARDTTCHSCGIKGHFSRVCNKSSNRDNHNHSSASKPVTASTFPHPLSEAVIKAKVNNIVINVLIDSGSSNSFINKSICDSLNLNPTKFNKQSVCMASKTCVSETIGSLNLNLELAGHKYTNVEFQVMPNLCCDAIVGHDILKLHQKLEINFQGKLPTLVVDHSICSVNSHNQSDLTCALLAAKIDPPPLFNHFPEGTRPIACKSRRYSPADKEFIDKEIDILLEDGIIEPSVSPWRAQVLVTNNENHKPRMVVDYSQTINKYTQLDAYPLPNIEGLAHKVAQYSVFSTFDLKSAYYQIPICNSDKPYTAFEASGRLYQFTRLPFGVTNGVASFQRIMDKIIDAENLSGTFAYLDNVTIGGVDQDDHDANVKRFLEVVEKYNLTLNHDKTISSVSEIRMIGYLISKGEIKPDPDRMEPLLIVPLPHDAASLKRALGLFSYYSPWIPKYSDMIQPLINKPMFPLCSAAKEAFQNIKQCIAKSSIVSPNNVDTLVLESDASDYAVSASLNQNGKPVAFFSRTLNSHEKHHHSVEKEACAIVEACRRWRHYLTGRRFLLITDQEAVSYMFSKNGSRGKMKNDKIQRWKIELSCFDFDIKFRPGKENVTADCLTRAFCAALSQTDMLKELHISLCHPGIVRFYHYVRTNNLPFSMEDVKQVVSQCITCAEIKPNFFKPKYTPLIKSSKPFERLSIDYKGPLPSDTRNRYLLTIVDEYSRFPFAFPCTDMLATTVKKCLIEIFFIFGEPGFVHSDRGRSFISDLLKSFLLQNGIGSSHSSAYNPRGNGQCERYNGTIWQTIRLALKSKGLPNTQWETVVPEALHAIRSLLCTSTNETPHDRLFNFPRKVSSSNTLPSWLMEQGKVLLRRHVKNSKYDDQCDEVDLVESNPSYARVRLPNGQEKSVSLRDLAPMPSLTQEVPNSISNNNPCNDLSISEPTVTSEPMIVAGPPTPIETSVSSTPLPNPVRQSQRVRSEPTRLDYQKLGG